MNDRNEKRFRMSIGATRRRQVTCAAALTERLLGQYYYETICRPRPIEDLSPQAYAGMALTYGVPWYELFGHSRHGARPQVKEAVHVLIRLEVTLCWSTARPLLYLLETASDGTCSSSQGRFALRCLSALRRHGVRIVDVRPSCMATPLLKPRLLALLYGDAYERFPIVGPSRGDASHGQRLVKHIRNVGVWMRHRLQQGPMVICVPRGAETSPLPRFVRQEPGALCCIPLQL